MANKITVMVFMFLVVVATQQVQNAVAEDQDFKERFNMCFDICQDDCDKKGHGGTFCEMKCDADCGAKEAAAKLGVNL